MKSEGNQDPQGCPSLWKLGFASSLQTFTFTLQKEKKERNKRWCVALSWTLWVNCLGINGHNVLMNTERWFSGWCVNWIDVKREKRWPLQRPLSMGTCLERNLMNDPDVRGWPGRPRLTLEHINSWGHLASFEIRQPQSASIWQRFYPPVEVRREPGQVALCFQTPQMIQRATEEKGKNVK